MKSIETVPIEIPGVKVEGEFPIKRFLEAIYNAALRPYGVEATATVYRRDDLDKPEDGESA